MNAVILIAVLSVGNSSVYASSRTMAALADRGQAPKILGYIDRSGRPLVSILVASSLGFLCYIVAASPETRNEAFNWMLALSGLSAIFTWCVVSRHLDSQLDSRHSLTWCIFRGSICLCHIRFRAAWRLAGRSTDELAYKSQATVYGSWLGLIMNMLILVAQFWTGFAPIGYADMSASDLTKNWFELYLAAPIVIVFYLSFKFWYGTRIRRTNEIDITSGKRDVEGLADIIADERRTRAAWPLWKKVWHLFC